MRLRSNTPKQGAFAGESAFNSDLAFSGKYAYAGNYNGFTVYDIRRPSQPREVTQVVDANFGIHAILPKTIFQR